ncbi:MAG TPA: low affinity iron permease family protein [Acidimicrobiales bacterium]|nr:low affinity iron permease family protein [Acidimicrobiales bacterium]
MVTELRESEKGTPITRTISNITGWLGSFPAILIALGIIAAWAVSGPMMHYSDTWQLVINTFTTLVTFVMVFVIQNSQNRDGRAIQLKLDELICAIRDADDRLVGIEEEPEKQIKQAQDEVRGRVHNEDEDDATSPSGDDAPRDELRTRPLRSA